MLPFWPEVLAPLLGELKPVSTVEIGTEHGKTADRLLELGASWGGVVHAVDPVPQFDVEAWQRRWGERFIFHREKSLDVLPEIERFDAVLIDGDHNWYTVHHELLMLERLAKAHGRGFPLVLLHDVGWPYGRRDLYYDPDDIPAAQRQPWAKRGMHPAQSELLPRGGFNAHLCNATHEGGPKNGVLTAVEDFAKVCGEELSQFRIPAAFGLAILLPKALEAAHPRLGELCRPWGSPHVEKFVERLELARLSGVVG